MVWSEPLHWSEPASALAWAIYRVRLVYRVRLIYRVRLRVVDLGPDLELVLDGAHGLIRG